MVQSSRSQVSWLIMNEHQENAAINLKALLYDDIWRKFALPLTPPSSPPRTFGESSDCSESIEDIADRLQDVCDSLDSAFYVPPTPRSDATSLRSKLISDCMWSGNHHVEAQNIKTSNTNPQKKISIDTEEDLYPTPCASPLPTVIEATDYPSSNDCVNPTTVFPLPPPENILYNLSCQSDTDEEIDVVTVDSFVTIPNVPIGSKRKSKQPNKNSPVPKIRNVSPPTTVPILQRAKSAPARVTSEKEKPLTKKCSFQDDSDPESRRTTHNVLERKRRIYLKNSFERLRECVPNLEKIDKTPKVIVLKKAATYIHDLNQRCVDLEEEKKVLLREKEELTLKLNELIKF